MGKHYTNEDHIRDLQVMIAADRAHGRAADKAGDTREAREAATAVRDGKAELARAIDKR
jgi:hypothetical protein